MTPVEQTFEQNEVEKSEVVETETKLAEATLENGSIIYYDGELTVETAIWSDEAMETPVEDGEYVLENGDKFVTVGGVITEFIPLTPEETEEPEAEEMEEVDFEKKYNDLLVIVEELKKDLQEFRATETQLKSEIEKLSAVPEVESISQEPQDKVEMSDLEKRMKALEAIRRMRKK